MDQGLLTRKSELVGRPADIVWSRYARPERRSSEPVFDFRIDASGRLLNTSTAALLRLSAGAPLRRDEGLLRPADAKFDIEWFDAVQLVSMAGSPQICRIGVRPRVAHACLQKGRSNDVLVTLEAEAICDEALFEVYALRYSLTCAERRILWKLSLGLEPKRIAFAQEISESTVRTHIKAILAKTGEPTIRHLVIRLARLPQVGNMRV
ncbi:MAG: helix-turn-helix transcriptional regulator [Burkholderiaceae bacterium]